MYSVKIKQTPELIKQSIKDFQPRETMQTDEMKDLDGIVKDAVKLKFLDKPLTKEQLTELIRTPPRKK
jgi:NitT/TauT family transport system substrate-binding protein